MVSFKSIILIAAAAFASIVSAVPTPEIGNSLNIAQRSPGSIGESLGQVSGHAFHHTLGKTLHDVNRLVDGILRRDVAEESISIGSLGLAVGSNPPSKRGGSSCKEVVQKCHDGIALIVVKIS